MTSDDVAHTNWAREHNGTGECAAFYMDFEKKAPYPCSCGYAAREAGSVRAPGRSSGNPNCCHS